MTFKSYFARTVEAAMEAARAQLGPDAMLVQSRRASPDTGREGEYEVVFASEQRETESARISATQDGEDLAALARELRDLRSDLEGTTAYLRRLSRNGQMSGDYAASEPFRMLTANGISDETAAQLAGTCADCADIRTWIAAAAGTDRLPVSTSPIALVGPAGAGRTTLLAKLAVQLGVASGRRVCLASMDTARVGGIEQLRTYALLLGAPFHELHSAEDLRRVLDASSAKDVVLIDTPPLTVAGTDEQESCRALLATDSRVSVYLVLSASTKAADSCRFAASGMASAIFFTRADETETIGTVLDVCVRTGLPLAGLSTGPTVPDDVDLDPVGWLAHHLNSERRAFNREAA